MQEAETSPLLYAAFLDLKGKDVLLVGGGDVAFRKARGLYQAGCRLTVVADEFLPSFRTWLASRRVPWEERPYRRKEAGAYLLIVSATDDPEVNRVIADDAVQAGRLVNVVDKPELCNFHVPSVARRGALQIAISTGGNCPALARKMRTEFEELVSESYGPLLHRLASIRRDLKKSVPSAHLRRKILERVLSSKAVQRFLAGEPRLLDRMMGGWERARTRCENPLPPDFTPRSA